MLEREREKSFEKKEKNMEKRENFFNEHLLNDKNILMYMCHNLKKKT